MPIKIFEVYMRSVFLSLLFLSALPVHALYVGNPAEPDIIEEGFLFCAEGWASIKMGYQGDLCFNRRLKAKDHAYGRMDAFSYGMNQGVLTFNILDLFEAYGSVGSMEGYLSHRPRHDLAQRNYDTGGDLTWGAGVRGEVFHWGATTLSVDGKYQSSHLPIRWNSINGHTYSTESKLKYREYQVSAGLSHQIDIFIPYLAVMYSCADAKLNHIRSEILSVSHFSMISRDRFGGALGCTLSPAYLIDLNFEVRMFSEQAVTIAGNFKF